MSTTTQTLGAPPPVPPEFTRAQLLYVWLTAFFSACLIMADLVGVKLFDIGGVKHTCGMLTFPLTFLITDLVNEYYGKRAARRMTYVAFAMALFAFLVLNVSLAMPYLDAPFNVSKKSFVDVFGSSRLMYVASLAAYLVGQLTDVTVFGFMKRLTAGKLLWLRATGSTVISQVIDSLIVTTLYWKAKELQTGEATTMGTILSYAATGYTLKLVLAVSVTPLIYAGHAVMKSAFGLTPLPPDPPKP